MRIWGIDEAREYKREDNNFYKGIVIKNNDPLKMNRVKIYIPEISNQPLEEWLKSYKSFSMRFPGSNNEYDSWADTQIYDEISKFCPWAEPCYPVMGEGGPGRYNHDSGLANISDGDYQENLEFDPEEAINDNISSVSPAFFYENLANWTGDDFSSPSQLYTDFNYYGCCYRANKYVNKAKGTFSVPSIGTRVWVFHNSGDLNFPVYFGYRSEFRETALINNFDRNKEEDDIKPEGESEEDAQNIPRDAYKINSLDYPDIFENIKNPNTQQF